MESPGSIRSVIPLFPASEQASASGGDKAKRCYPIGRTARGSSLALGTMSWGVAQALIRRFGRDQGWVMIAKISLYSAPMRGQLAAIRFASVMHWVSALFLAVGGFVVAYSIWYWLLGRYRVDQVTPSALLMPPFGLLAGWLLFGDNIGTSELVGALVIVAGLWIIVRSPIPTSVRL
jgi:O-acetylserine/cysteine efflux transporter